MARFEPPVAQRRAPPTASGSAAPPSCGGRPRWRSTAAGQLWPVGPVADEQAVPAGLVGRLDHQFAEVVEHERPLVGASGSGTSARWGGAAPRRGSSGSCRAPTRRRPCRRPRRRRARWRCRRCPPSTPAAGRARRARSRGGTPRGRGTGRRCGGRSRRTRAARRWCACTRGRRRRRRGRGPRPARRPSAGPGSGARSRPSCRCPGVSTTTVGRLDVGRGQRPSSVVAARRCSRRPGRMLSCSNRSAKARLEIGPVLEHVADARRHPQVVLQHVHGAVGVAHEVAAADVGPDAERRVARRGTRAGSWPTGEQLGGEHAVGDDVAGRCRRRR